MSQEQTREQRLEALLVECLRYVYYKPVVAKIEAETGTSAEDVRAAAGLTYAVKTPPADR